MVDTDFNFRRTRMIEVTDAVETGKTFKQFRNHLGLTQTQVSEHWGISRTHLQRLERGSIGWTNRTLTEGQQTLIELAAKAGKK